MRRRPLCILLAVMCPAAAILSTSPTSLPSLYSAQSGSDNEKTQCSNINTLPQSQQCKFLMNNCSLPEDPAPPYLKLYYCSGTRRGAILLLSASLVLSFVSLAHAASEFLCPNLYAISKLLKLSDNLSGLTLLAFGNGSADIFSTYHAIESGSMGLAASELISAALFILTIVVGSISIAKPFKVPRFFFFRDTFFYLLISTLVLVILVLGAINYYLASALMVSYVAYVAFAVYSHSYLSKFIRSLSNIAQVRSNYSWNPEGAISDSEPEDPQYPSINDLLHEVENEEELIDDEFAEFLASHPHPSLEEHIPIGAGSYALKLLLKLLMKHSSALVLKKLQPIALSPDLSPVQSPITQPEALAPRLGSTEYLLSAAAPEQRPFWKHLLPDIFPGQPLLLQIYLVLTAPASIAFKLTIPNRTACLQHCEKLGSYDGFVANFSSNELLSSEDEDYDFRVDNTFFRIQIVFSAIMICLKLYGTSYWPVSSLAVFLIFSGLAYFVPYQCPRFQENLNQHAVWNNFGSVLGFGTSLVWISIFASEIVSILRAAGIIFMVSDDKVGATLFAFGNSIGDFVSNLLIARMGMPVMAFSACFGGPLLSICSLGLSSFVVMARTKRDSIPIQFSNVMKITLLALISTLLFLVVFIPRNGWMFDKKVGFILTGWWLLLMSMILIF